MTTRTPSVRSLIKATVVLLIASTLPALAQKYEMLFGSTSCLETGHAGFRVPVGGYISAGSTRSSNANCTNNDVYVVRLFDNGTLNWSTSYDLGGDDRCDDIKQCLNGDFILTGSTDYTPQGGSSTREVFLLRISSTGQVVWCSFYGTDTRDEEGFRVIETKRAPGAPVSGTAAGDFVVAGVRYPVAGSGDGLLIRASSTGALVWARTYGANYNDYLNSLDECNVGAAPSGDIVASGGTASYSPGNIMNGFLLRVSGANGSIGAAPQNAASIGGSIYTRFNSVREIKLGNDAGRIIAAGGMIPAVAGAGFDIYVLKTENNPCTKVVDRQYGDNDVRIDEAFCIKEIQAGPGGGLVNGHFYVVGESGLVTGNNGDMFAMEITVNLPIAPPLNFKTYGQDSYERAWDVFWSDTVPGFRTQGPYLTGTAQPVGAANGILVAGDPGQMYVVKGDREGWDDCNDHDPDINEYTPDLDLECLEIDPVSVGRRVVRDIDSVQRFWSDTLCNDSAVAPPAPGLSPDADEAISSVRRLDPQSLGSLTFYPNPVSRGDLFTIGYTIPADRTISVSLTDLGGRAIEARNGVHRGGTGEISLPTEGLAAGTYLVTVSFEGRSETRRLVVADR